MNRDLEEQVNEMGPDYRAVVARLRAAREAEPPTRMGERRVTRGWLVAASLVVIVGFAAVFFSRPSGPLRPSCPLARSAPREYVMTVPEMIASQNPDGSWKNDFLTRRNAEALRCCGGAAAQVAYKRAVRNLRSKGLL